LQQDYNALFGLRSLPRRLDILRRAYLNNRFERRSPIPPLPEDLWRLVHGHDLVFPPRNLLLRPGSQSVEGLFFLGSLLKSLQARTVFEIGTFEGVTSWFLARNAAPETIVHTLDIPPEAAPRFPLDASDVHRADPGALLHERLPRPPARIEQHWGDSATFDFAPWQGACDLVYIDGAHSEHYVRSDTHNALEMAGEDGAIVWDDYWRLSEGVTKVVEGLLDLGLCRVPATRLVVRLGPGARARLEQGG
jgi:hypothetical protein